MANVSIGAPAALQLFPKDGAKSQKKNKLHDPTQKHDDDNDEHNNVISNLGVGDDDNNDSTSNSGVGICADVYMSNLGVGMESTDEVDIVPQGLDSNFWGCFILEQWNNCNQH